MVLTEEQKRELLRKYIDPEKDFVRAGNGKILVSVEASQRIAEAFNLKIASNAQFEPFAIANYIVQREQQRLAAAASIAKSKEEREALENAKLDKVINCIKNLLEQQKNDFEIAQGLQLECSDLALSDIRRGIAKATQDGVLPQNNLVENNLMILTMRRALTAKFMEFNNATQDQAKLAAVLEQNIYKLYTDGRLSLGHLRIALLDAGIQDETIETAVNGFYQRYEVDFLNQYTNVELPFEKLADQIFNKYLENDVFDSRVILGYIEKMNKENLNLEEFAYYLYVKDRDEELVSKIMMIPGISVEERVRKLKELELEYPPICIKRTFDKLKGAIVLPYDEIFEKYVSSGIQADEDDEELVAVNEVISTLNEEGDSFEEEPALLENGENSGGLGDDIEEEYQPRRLKIVKKEKEVKDIEKKKTLATLLIGAGFVPVAVLAWVFKVDPLVASKNCVTALGQLINGDMGVRDFLPNASQLTALLAGMGTTFVGTIKYFKSKKKLKQVKDELADLEELEELEASTSVIKGRR